MQRLLDKLYYLKISFKELLPVIVATCFQIAHKSQRFHRLPDEIKLHGQSSRVKNLQQIHEFSLPSFLPSYFEFFKKKEKLKILLRYLKNLSKNCRSCNYYSGKWSKQNLFSDLNLKITLVENKRRGEGD